MSKSLPITWLTALQLASHPSWPGASAQQVLPCHGRRTKIPGDRWRTERLPRDRISQSMFLPLAPTACPPETKTVNRLKDEFLGQRVPCWLPSAYRSGAAPPTGPRLSGWPHAGNRKIRRAFSVVMAASSASDIPLASATTAAVCATQPGSLRLPRFGIGAR